MANAFARNPPFESSPRCCACVLRGQDGSITEGKLGARAESQLPRHSGVLPCIVHARRGRSVSAELVAITVRVVVVMIRGRLNAERAVYPASDTARNSADRGAYGRANRAGNSVARRASDRNPLLGASYDPLSLSDQRHGQECQSGSQGENPRGHGGLLR